MSTQHTPHYALCQQEPELIYDGDMLIAEVYNDAKLAAHIVACLRACAGIPTAALEAGVVMEMREALRVLISRIMDDAGGADLLPVHPDWDPENNAAIQAARAVLAKMEADHATRG